MLSALLRAGECPAAGNGRREFRARVRETSRIAGGRERGGGVAWKSENSPSRVAA